MTARSDNAIHIGAFRRLVATTLGAAMLAGCTSVDVGPYYDAAVTNYEAARVLEKEVIEVRSSAWDEEFGVLFDEVEQLTKTQLKQIIVLQWLPDEKDFNGATRDTAWKAFAGVTSDDALPVGFATTKQPILVKHLSVVLWTTTGTQPIAVTGAAVLKKPGGVAGYTGDSVPQDPIAVNERYKAWLKELEKTVFDEMPVVEKIAAARATALKSIRSEQERGGARVDATYNALIRMTLTTKQYAETITRNAQFISLANRILESANTVLGKLTSPSLETEKQGEPTDA